MDRFWASVVAEELGWDMRKVVRWLGGEGGDVGRAKKVARSDFESEC